MRCINEIDNKFILNQSIYQTKKQTSKETKNKERKKKQRKEKETKKKWQTNFEQMCNERCSYVCWIHFVWKVKLDGSDVWSSFNISQLKNKTGVVSIGYFNALMASFLHTEVYFDCNFPECISQS